MSGWIKDWRKELESNIWLMPPLYHRVWQWIKYNVNHEPNKVPFKDGKVVEVGKGEKITSYRQIANGVGYYERGIWREPNVKTIRDILEWLRNEQMIDIESNSQYTRIKVLNWDIYQAPAQDVSNSQETVSKQSLDTNKNDKNDKKYYGEFVRLTDEEHQKLTERLGQALTADYIERLNNYIGSKGTKYKSHYHTILTWVRNDEKKQAEPPTRKRQLYMPEGDE
jgi:hypothetical protein